MRIRDKEIFVLFVIGFTFVLIILCSGYSSVSNWLWQYRNQVTSYQYTEKYYIHSENSYEVKFMDYDLLEEQGYLEGDDTQFEKCLDLCKEDTADMVDILSNQNNTTYVSNLYLDVGECGVYRGIDIVFSYKDVWYRDLAEWQYPSIEDNSDICAVIGESLLSETQIINGKSYIWIADRYIEVSGVFENYNASEEDYSLVVFGGKTFFAESNAFGERLSKDINDDTTVIIMGSSSCLISKEAFESEVNRSSSLYLGEPGDMLRISIERSEKGLSRNIWDYLYNIKSMILCVMVLFGIINCVMLSRVWAVRRQKDFLVMRIYGLSNRKIIFLILKELFMMAGIGLFFAAVISVIYISVTDGWRASEHMAEWLVVVLFLGIFITVAVCVLSVFLYVNKLKPAQAVRE